MFIRIPQCSIALFAALSACNPCDLQQGTGNEPDGRMILRGKTRTGAGAPVAVDCDGERGSAIEG